MKIQKPLLIAALLALLIGSLYAASGAASRAPERAGKEEKDTGAPPLRVVTAGHSPVSALRESLEMQIGLCRLELNLPPEPKGMPSDAQLAQVASIETEELFDGARYAQYEVSRNLMPDTKDGCKVKLLQHFSVTLETSCDRQWSASAGARDFDIEPLSATEHEHTRNPALLKHAPCHARAVIEPRLQAAFDKTSRQSAGLGQQCLWSNEVDLHLAAEDAGRAVVDEDRLSGSCQYAPLPYYPYTTYQGARRMVTLQMRMPPKASAGLKTFGINYGTFQPKLKDFSIGIAIPAGRFSQSDALAFLKQPAIVTLADPAK